MAFGVCMDHVRAAWEPWYGSESPLMLVLIEMICYNRHLGNTIMTCKHIAQAVPRLSH